MNNPCDICIVNAMCRHRCDKFDDYLRENLPDYWKMWHWHIAGCVRAGSSKLLYLGHHIFKVEGGWSKGE